ncbi:MAG: hypothetical protein DI603_15070 [Roseateles depolymerans]|uniref:Uncharacterized protein n=1 Tax=Roseateles depolymerans TaxID=76731 RepID=A0A2W5DIL5_9BURK|nr:MAG: hypothetical protein DI603_15070 [Roseateles depolymerans]
MAVLQNTGRIALARAIASQSIHLAWGRGDPAWDAQPQPEPTDATALADEIGRRIATQVGYARPDANGEIEMVSGRYTQSAQPTKWLYVRFTFDFGDAELQTVRELGIFVGTQPAAGVPPGQRYLTPDQVAVAGDLYALERLPKFTRNGAVRQVFEYVLPF